MRRLDVCRVEQSWLRGAWLADGTCSVRSCAKRGRLLITTPMNMLAVRARIVVGVLHAGGRCRVRIENDTGWLNCVASFNCAIEKTCAEKICGCRDGRCWSVCGQLDKRVIAGTIQAQPPVLASGGTGGLWLLLKIRWCDNDAWLELDGRVGGLVTLSLAARVQPLPPIANTVACSVEW